MMHYKKIIIIIIISVVLFVAWLIGFLDVNSRFPQVKCEEYHLDEWVDYSNRYWGYDNLQLSPVKITIYSAKDFESGYPEEGEEYKDTSYKIVVMKVKIKNNSSQEISVGKVFSFFTAGAEPIGWNNQGRIIDSKNTNILPGGNQEDVELYVVLSESVVSSRNYDRFLKNKIFLSVKSYPLRQILVFDEIDVK